VRLDPRIGKSGSTGEALTWRRPWPRLRSSIPVARGWPARSPAAAGSTARPRRPRLERLTW